MKPLRIALTKGRLEKDTVALLEKMGIDCTSVHHKGRQLILPIGDGQIEVVLAKAADVITYVEHGVCDLGVVGKDTIMENGSRFYEVLDLGFGRCRFALAGPKDQDFYQGFSEKTVASKYPNVTRAFFEGKAMGSTLKENGLEVKEFVADISARLIVNIASMKLRKKEIESLAARMEAAIKETGKEEEK